MGLLSELDKLITEHGSSAILRERLLLVKDKFEHLEKENADLKRDLLKSHEECKSLRAQIKNQSIAEQFVEHEGMLFKRKAGGEYQSAVFCPSCKMAMGTIDDSIPFDCDKCGIISPWRKQDLPRVIKELPT